MASRWRKCKLPKKTLPELHPRALIAEKCRFAGTIEGDKPSQSIDFGEAIVDGINYAITFHQDFTREQQAQLIKKKKQVIWIGSKTGCCEFVIGLNDEDAP
jgi:hypothetical protein